MPKIKLTKKLLQDEARKFAQVESCHDEPSLFGVTDGKAVGTYLEHKFQKYLKTKYDYVEGSSARGIDFPELLIDMKVTSIRQPQSSCPFKSAKQKIFGLGYSLIIFVYEKKIIKIELVVLISNMRYLLNNIVLRISKQHLDLKKY